MIEFVGSMDKRFKSRLVSRYEQFEFQAGLMKSDERKPHYPAKSKRAGFTAVDGMRARRRRLSAVGRKPNLKQIYKLACERAGVDIVKAPFQSHNSKTVRALQAILTKFFKSTRPLSMKREVEDAMVAIIRDPIRRKKYGRNAVSVIRTKGFNRLLFDTGQLYKAFKAKVSRRAARKTA